MGLNINEALARIDEINADSHFWDHPLWKGLLEGTHTKPMVQEFARQYAIYPLHNHNYHGRLYVICPDPKWRALIAEVVYEEGTGRLHAEGTPHNELWYWFAEGMGVSREDMAATKYCAGALALKAYFSNICGSNFLDGVAAHMLASEALVPGYYAQLAESLRTTFDLDDKGVAFFVIHNVADEDHSSIGREILEDFTTSEKDLERVLEVVREMNAVMALQNEDTWRAMQAAA